MLGFELLCLGHGFWFISALAEKCLHRLVIHFIFVYVPQINTLFPLLSFALPPFFSPYCWCVTSPPILLQLPPFTYTHTNTHTHTLALAVPDVCRDDVMADRRHWTLIPLFFSRKHSSQTREHEAEERCVDKFTDNIVGLRCLKHSYRPPISRVVWFFWVTACLS